MNSQIIIRDLNFFGFHGVYPEEQVVGTNFRADIIIDIDDLPGFHTDELDDTLNYELIIARILEIGTKHKFKLVEKLVQTIAEEILSFEHVRAVDVTVHKLVKTLTPEPQWIGVRRYINR